MKGLKRGEGLTLIRAALKTMLSDPQILTGTCGFDRFFRLSS